MKRYFRIYFGTLSGIFPIIDHIQAVIYQLKSMTYDTFTSMTSFYYRYLRQRVDVFQ